MPYTWIPYFLPCVTTLPKHTAVSRQGLRATGLALPLVQLRHALEYIEANLSQDVSLADVANASATSVSSLTRGFKTALGISPHSWVLNRRIALAQRLIYKGATPLNEVAISCGFADQSHLTRVFVRSVGSSPAVWRRNAQR